MAKAKTKARGSDTGTRERKVPAFVFDCVCHIFNFDTGGLLQWTQVKNELMRNSSVLSLIQHRIVFFKP